MDIYLAALQLGKYPPLFTSTSVNNWMRILNGIFVISRIIKVEVGVISCQRLRLITVKETLIILDITKTEPTL